MKVGDLIELLEGVDEKAEVRLASQPSWPLQYHLHREVIEGDDEDGGPVVWLVEAGQVYDSPYLPGFVSEALGWR
jgi:hypothetical protein